MNKYTTPQICDWLGITNTTLYRWVKRGFISAEQVPDGAYLYDKTEIVKALNKPGLKYTRFGRRVWSSLKYDPWVQGVLADE